MVKYRVLVTSNATVSAVVMVEAESAADAEQLALDKANTGGGIRWTWDDANGTDPYIGDPGNAATPVEPRYSNYYECPDCQNKWFVPDAEDDAETDDCEKCGCADIEPYDSDEEG